VLDTSSRDILDLCIECRSCCWVRRVRWARSRVTEGAYEEKEKTVVYAAELEYLDTQEFEKVEREWSEIWVAT
jgi:hypothetical protein